MSVFDFQDSRTTGGENQNKNMFAELFKFRPERYERTLNQTTTPGTNAAIPIDLLSLFEKLPEAANKKAERKNESAPDNRGTRYDATSADIKAIFPELAHRITGRAGEPISLHDIGKALGDPKIRGRDAQVLVALKLSFDKIARLDSSNLEKPKNNRTLSAKSIDALDRLVSQRRSNQLQDKDALGLLESLDDAMVRTSDSVKSTVRTLYRDQAKPLESLVPDAVQQAGIGNCYFYGALAALAAANPDEIRKMIRENQDGSYKVKFPGQKEIDVAAPSDAEITLYPKAGQFGSWVWVMEKAYGQYCMKDPSALAFRRLLGRDDSPVPQEHTEGPSFLDGGLRILTGKPINHVWNARPDDLHAQLSELMLEKPR